MSQRQGDDVTDRLAFSRRDYDPEANIRAAMAYIRERYGPIGTEPGHGLWQDIPSTWPKAEPKLHQRIWRRLVDFLDYAWMYVMVAVTPDEVDR